jgi:hypothetical protein
MSSEVKQMGVARVPTSVRRFGGGMSKSVHSAEILQFPFTSFRAQEGEVFVFSVDMDW